MRKLYEIFKVLKVQKRIVSAETIRGNMVAQGFTVYSKLLQNYFQLTLIEDKINVFC